MAFNQELTGASGSFSVGSETVSFTAVATGGNLDTLSSGFGDIDGTNYHIGNPGESPETYTFNLIKRFRACRSM